MGVGGNENGRNFFKDKGWDDVASAKVSTMLMNAMAGERDGDHPSAPRVMSNASHGRWVEASACRARGLACG
jgi:hypothetical protein